MMPAGFRGEPLLAGQETQRYSARGRHCARTPVQNMLRGLAAGTARWTTKARKSECYYSWWLAVSTTCHRFTILSDSAY